MRHRASRLLLYLAALPSLYFGLVYLVRVFLGTGWAANYHERLAAGLPYAEVPAPIAALYTTLVGVLGALFLAIGAAQIVLIAGTDLARITAAWQSLAVLNGVALGGLIAVNLRNGLDSPWWMNAIALVLVAIGLSLARPIAIAIAEVGSLRRAQPHAN